MSFPKICIMGNPEKITRFWDKVKISSNDECWNWIGYKNQGYGSFNVGPKKNDKAHRISWRLTYGEIPKGLFVCHKCDNRACCNPYHLFLGTPMENWKDCVSKGRHYQPKGELNPSSKLTESQVVQIRNLYSEGLTLIAIAKMFSVGKSIISKIVRKEVWK